MPALRAAVKIAYRLPVGPFVGFLIMLFRFFNANWADRLTYRLLLEQRRYHLRLLVGGKVVEG